MKKAKEGNSFEQRKARKWFVAQRNGTGGLWNSTCFTSRDIENLSGFSPHAVPQPAPIVSRSLDVSVGVLPKADPATRAHMQMFTWEVIPGDARRLVGKVRQERVPVRCIREEVSANM